MREVGMEQPLQVESGGGELPFPLCGAASTWRSSRNPMTSPVPSPSAGFIQPQVKNVFNVRTLTSQPLRPCPELLGEDPYLHSLFAKSLQTLKPDLSFREQNLVPHTAGSIMVSVFCHKITRGKHWKIQVQFYPTKQKSKTEQQAENKGKG